MNQIGIIYVIISKWLKHIESRLWYLLFVCIAMSITIYCYIVYSQIQNQNIFFKTHIHEDHLVDSVSFIVNFDYALTSINNDIEDNLNNGNNIEDPYYRLEAFSKSKGNYHPQGGLSKGSIVVKHEFNSFVADESWFFPRSQTLFKDFKESDETIPVHSRTPGQEVSKTVEFRSDYDYFIGRHYKEVFYKGDLTLSNKDFLLHLKEESADSSNVTTYIDSISYQHSIKEGVFNSGLFSPFDLSQFYLSINYEFPSEFINKNSIVFNFNGLIKPENIYPEPDIIKPNSLVYTDLDKLNIISSNGIKCLISFPQNDSLQKVRLYVISALITILFTFFCKIIWDIIKKKYQERKRFSFVKSLLLKQKHTNLYLSFCKHRYLANTCICLIISVILYFLSPKEMIFMPIYLLVFVVLLIPYSCYSFSIVKGIREGLHLDEEYKKLIKFPFLACLLLFLGLFILRFCYNSFSISFLTTSKKLALFICALFLIFMYKYLQSNVESKLATLKSEASYKKSIKKDVIFVIVLCILYGFLFLRLSSSSFGFKLLFLAYLLFCIYKVIYKLRH